MKGAENEGFRTERRQDICENPSVACTDAAAEEDSRSAVGVPSELLGVPLVDFDLPGEETFVVIARRFGKQVVYRFSQEKSLYLFSPKSSLRQLVIFITTNQCFELFIVLLIISNCVILAFNNPPEEIEYVFAAFYTMEMILKIIAKGFCLHRFAYLRDPWNWMDFLVVILGYLTLAPSVANLSGIRTFRVLRALRTISVIEGLRTMVNAFLRSMRMLTDVLVLALFFISIFALIGMQLFVGVLRNKCVLSPDRNLTDLDKYLANDSNWLYVNDKPLVCGNSSLARSCPSNYTCFSNVGDNPNHGYTSFDTFPWALLCTLQLVTADYWENVYEHIIAAGGFWYLSYFLMVIFFGSFYLLNLILAVVALSYQQELVNLDSQAAGYDKLRKSSSSYSLHVSLRPQKLFESKPVSPFSNWSSVLHRLNDNTPYGSNTGLSPGTYLPSSDTEHMTSPRPLTIPSGALLEEPGFCLFDDVSVLSYNVCNTDFSIQTINVSNPEGEIVTAKPSSGNLKLEPRLESVACQNPNLESANRLSIENHPTLVQTSSLCVVIPSNRDKHGHPTSMNVIRRKCASVITSPVFDWFITAIIFINTVFMAVEYHGMDRRLEMTVDIVNLICTFVFVLELLIKVTALFPRGYIQSRWNLLDGFIVAISIVDLGLVLCLPNVTHGVGFSVLRSFRLIRILKLARSWVTMRALLSTIGVSIGQLGNLTLLLGIVTYTFAVIGMQLFSESFNPDKFHDNEVPRWNFSDFLHSFMIIFRVLCGEWIEPLVLTMHVTSATSILFYFAVLILGNFLILNLFLALLLNSFATVSLNAGNEHSENVKEKFHRIVRRLMNVVRVFRSTSVSSESDSPKKSADGDPVQRANNSWDTRESKGSERTDGTNQDKQESNSVSCVVSMQGTEKGEGIEKQTESGVDNKQARPNTTRSADNIESKTCPSTSSKNAARSTLDMTTVKRSQDSSQCCDPVVAECFPSLCCPGYLPDSARQSWVYSVFVASRLKVVNIVEHKLFDGFILCVIIISSVSLAFEDVHLNSKPTLKAFLDVLNYVVTAIFTLEFFLKLFGLGFVQYFRNSWNCLDLLIVVVSVVSLVDSVGGGSNNNLTAFRSLRTLRALRPLRAIPRWQGMKVVVNSLLSAIPEIGNVSLVCLIFWLIFSVMGVQFFGGRFFKCVDDDGEILSASIVPNKTTCLALSYTWKNSDINFDNSLAGFLALFQVATFEGWIEIMRDAADVTEVDHQPKRDNNHISHLYFVVFVLFGSFFVLNLFVGVIIDNFNRLKKQYEGHGAIGLFLTDTQKAWYDTLKKAASKRPRKVLQKPKGKWRASMFDVVNSLKFEFVIMLLILANMVVMVIQHHGQSELTTKILDILFQF